MAHHSHHMDRSNENPTRLHESELRSHESDSSSTRPLNPTVRDFDVEAQPQSRPSSESKRVRVIEPPSSGSSSDGQATSSAHQIPNRTDTMTTRSSRKSVRRRGRAATTNVSYSAAEMGRRASWTPGQEPGLDPNASAEQHSHPDGLNRPCEITCVDYSMDNMSLVNLDNTNVEEYLEKPVPDWSQVRWINVNGLSLDVIRIIGRHKGLHPLALEDLLNSRSRTKADWYSDHTFIVLPLQKLVHTEPRDDSSDDEDDDDSSKNQDNDTEEGEKKDTYFMSEHDRRTHEAKHKKKRRGAIQQLIRDIFKTKKTRRHPQSQDGPNKANNIRTSGKLMPPWLPKDVRTLQRYHAGPNQDRISFMERNAVLLDRGLGVSIEQVSLFLTADNTVISFFEYSASDVETPIIRRLSTPGTILRQTGDASMLMQSILDAVIDLAIPVTTAYQDALGDLELEVLTDPEIRESKTLYILTSEIAVLRNAIAPVAQLMSALKYHKSNAETAMTMASQNASMYDGNSGVGARPGASRHASYYPFAQTQTVTISPLTVTYLGDVEDHALLISDSYDQMRRSADNLVDLIFNTVSAYQNESMKQLTVVTAFFLPLTFLTGYFGMNFGVFPIATENSDATFWIISAPVCFVVFILLLRDPIWRFVGTWANKMLINRVRRRRLESES